MNAQSTRYSDLPESDALCDGCKYCLRGQPLEGKCPECGMTVAKSMARVADREAGLAAVTGRNDERRASDLRWGPWLLLIVWIVVQFVTNWEARQLNLFGAQQVFSGRYDGHIYIACFYLGTAGLFFSTRRARLGNEPKDVSVLRWIVRGLSILAMPLYLVSGIQSYSSL